MCIVWDIVLVAEESRNAAGTAAAVPKFTDHEGKYLENSCCLTSPDFKQMHVNFTKYWGIL